MRLIGVTIEQIEEGLKNGKLSSDIVEFLDYQERGERHPVVHLDLFPNGTKTFSDLFKSRWPREAKKLEHYYWVCSLPKDKRDKEMKKLYPHAWDMIDYVLNFMMKRKNEQK